MGTSHALPQTFDPLFAAGNGLGFSATGSIVAVTAGWVSAAWANAVGNAGVTEGLAVADGHSVGVSGIGVSS